MAKYGTNRSKSGASVHDRNARKGKHATTTQTGRQRSSGSNLGMGKGVKESPDRPVSGGGDRAHN